MQQTNGYQPQFPQVRQPIESLFNWVNKKTGIQIVSKVRSYQGLMVHVFGKLAAAFVSHAAAGKFVRLIFKLWIGIKVKNYTRTPNSDEPNWKRLNFMKSFLSGTIGENKWGGDKMMTALQNKTVVITAGNRGGGLALSQKYAENGANVVMIADKSDLINNHTVFPEKSELIAVDFADEKQIENAVNTIIAQFGSLDILINNFSIFNFKNTMGTTPEMFYSVMKNVFATLFFSKACTPYMKNAPNPHIINISPPFNMDSAKLACEHHLLFSISKYGMSFSTLGMAEEFKSLGIAVNSLWQERPIATKTLLHNFDNAVVQGSNRPEVYAEAAYLISLKPAREFTGNYCIDEDILREANIEPSQYAVNPHAIPVKDIFLSGVDYELLKTVF